ncbi:ATPase [Mycolicibacterium litorale]|uniref:ATPase n=1 Tax=Mycolicibacterium litorale TaxID=758802 RepID=UPI003CFB733D
MAKHRGGKRRSKKIAALGAATVTATALTVGASPVPEAAAATTRSADAVDLTADFRLFPPPQAIPDLTFGAGQAAYDVKNAFADFVFRSIFDNVNLAALARTLGVDPQSIIERVLENLPLALLTDPIFGIVNNLPLPIGNLVSQLPLLGDLLGDILGNGLNQAGINTIGEILGILGLDLSNPFDLSGIGDRLGVNVVTSGHVFTLLKLLGVDLGWAPTLPNSIADDVDGTDYLGVGVDGLLEVIDTPAASIVTLLNRILERLQLGSLDDIPDVFKARVPIVIGDGVGAFAAGMAYQDILADLPNQPGGANYNGSEAAPLLGSVSVLPMLLLRNPGRANGGLFARLYPLARLLGIDTVTPETELSNSGGTLLPGGLYLGGATLVPVKIDVALQHDPLSDFASWANPFSLLNSLVATVLPTYNLRGLEVGEIAGAVGEQLAPQLGDVVEGSLEGDPLALNFYLTVPINALPLLEPTYLLVDAINLLTGANFNNPIGTALAPALSSLINLGYTDVERVWNDDGDYWEYVRTFDDSDVPTAFGSFPDINWLNVPGDIVGALGAGVRQAFEDGLVNRDGPVKNVLATVLNLLGLDGGLPGGIGNLGLDGVFDQIRDTVEDVLGGLPVPRASAAAADAVPDASAAKVSLKTETPATDGKDAEETDTDAESPSTEETPAEPAEESDEEEAPVDPEAEAGDPAAEDETDEDAADEDAADEDAADDAEDTQADETDEDVADEKPSDTDSSDGADAGGSDTGDKSDSGDSEKAAA